jgi:hypothetical protein
MSFTIFTTNDLYLDKMQLEGIHGGVYEPTKS